MTIEEPLVPKVTNYCLDNDATSEKVAPLYDYDTELYNKIEAIISSMPPLVL